MSIIMKISENHCSNSLQLSGNVWKPLSALFNTELSSRFVLSTFYEVQVSEKRFDFKKVSLKKASKEVSIY